MTSLAVGHSTASLAVLELARRYESGFDTAGVSSEAHYFEGLADSLKQDPNLLNDVLRRVCARYTQANGNADIAEEFLHTALTAARQPPQVVEMLTKLAQWMAAGSGPLHGHALYDDERTWAQVTSELLATMSPA